MQPNIASAITFIRQKQAALREEIQSIDKAIQLLLSGDVTQQEQPKEKPVKYIKIEDDPLKRKRGRPAKVIYVQDSVQEKREKLRLNEKIVRILRSKYRFLSEAEIVSACINNYASERALSREEVLAKVKLALGELEKEKKVVEFAGMDMKKNYWGFEEWINRKGEIEPEHMYIP